MHDNLTGIVYFVNAFGWMVWGGLGFLGLIGLTGALKEEGEAICKSSFLFLRLAFFIYWGCNSIIAMHILKCIGRKFGVWE